MTTPIQIKLFAIAIFFGTYSLPSLSTAALVLLDSVAIVVDENVIMQSEIDERIRSIKAQIAATPDGNVPSAAALEKQIHERLIIESLQLQKAERAGIRISDDELNQAMATIAAQNRMSLEQFQVAISGDGLSWPEMREQVRREISINRIQQGTMRQRIRISEQEINNFLSSEEGAAVTADEVRLGHILLPLTSSATADEIRATRDQANEILHQLEQGADFGSLAIEWSADQNALNGGDMGWRKPVQLPGIFADLVGDMETGDVSQPIKSGRGYHIITVFDKRGANAEGQIAQSEVRHILIKQNEIRTDQESEDLANSLRAEILAGRSFEEVAKLYSDDPGSALSGGDLGWTRAGTFVPIFESTIQSSELNEISVVFKSEHGYHFLEVTGRRIEDFSERFKMGQAENYLRNQKFDEEVENWIREIREDAFVEIKI